jgi:hypothetical protein
MHSLRNRLFLLASLGGVAAAAGAACSSSSSSQPFNPGGDDGAASSSGGGGTRSDAASDAPEEPAAPAEPCGDAMLSLPTGSALGGACGDCLNSKCMGSLAVCQDDCTCVASVNCLVVNADNYTHCDEAMTAIGEGNNGLTMVASCLVMQCPVCNQVPD